MKKVVLFLALITISTLTAFSQPGCFPDDCDNVAQAPITYSVFHPSCNLTCTYTVFYSECIIENVSTFLIDSVAASPYNDPCCQGTATNDPMVAGYILDEAGRLISLTGIGSDTINVYTPSRCWKWEGTLGPSGIHNAVLVTCDHGISCCIMIYVIEGGDSEIIGTYSSGLMTCDPTEACMRICD